MAKIIEVPNNQCPIDRMVEIQNNGGLNGRFFLSEKCFEEMHMSADNVTKGDGAIYLHWDTTADTAATDCIIKLPVKQGGILKPRYEIISIEAEDIHFKRKKDRLAEYTIFKRKNEKLSY